MDCCAEDGGVAGGMEVVCIRSTERNADSWKTVAPVRCLSGASHSMSLRKIKIGPSGVRMALGVTGQAELDSPDKRMFP